MPKITYLLYAVVTMYVCKLSFAIYLRLEGSDTFRNPLDYPDLKLGRLYWVNNLLSLNRKELNLLVAMIQVISDAYLVVHVEIFKLCGLLRIFELYL